MTEENPKAPKCDRCGKIGRVYYRSDLDQHLCPSCFVLKGGEKSKEND